MAESIDIKIPDLGDFSDVEVIEVLVSAGDSVAKEDGLITLETDKATMDVPAAEAGVIEEMTVKVGDRVSTGDVIGRMRQEAADDAAQDSQNDAAEFEEKEAAAEADADRGAGEERPAPGSGGSSATETLKVPDIGDFSDVDVIEVHVAEGDEVAIDDSLITLETDKAAMDVPATAAGVVKSLSVKVGDKVSEGSEIAVVETAAAPPKKGDDKPPETRREKAPDVEPGVSASTADARAGRESGASKPTQRERPAIDEAGFAKAHASPSVRKLARELGVDLGRVKGSGPKDRILHEDVKAFVKSVMTGEGGGAAALPKVPEVDFAKFGEIETETLSRIQKISGPRLQASWVNVPHVTQHDLADITELEAKRQELKGPAKERGISLTPLAFIMRACIAALKEFPKANSSLSADGESLVYKKYYHLGFAADTDKGLVVPVIRNADKKDVYELAEELGTLSRAAREGKLKADQMQGASFTISSLGGIGGTAFTPIVNAPEVAILGVSRSSMQPVWDGEAFKPRLMLPLSLSYDHRVIDGAYAVRFTTFLGEKLGDVDALLEAIP